MPVYLADTACLLRKESSGEKLLLLYFFMRESGLKLILLRKAGPSRSVQGEPDLFEIGEVAASQTDPSRPLFLQDFHLLQRFAGIAHNYRSLQAASALSGFYERNLLHLENFAKAWDLLEKALQALAKGDCPETVLLKCLFLFARSEGYPVSAQWLNGLSGPTRAEVEQILKTPIALLSNKYSASGNHLLSLYDFFARETDLIPPQSVP